MRAYVRPTDAALEALSLALDCMLEKGHGEPSAAWTRIVYLVTRAHPQMPTHRADALRDRLAHSQTQLRVIGVDLGAEAPPAFWRPWVARVPGALLATPEEAEAHALEPTVQRPRSNPIHTTLSFGELDSASRASIEIPVQLHKATAQQRPMAPRRMARGDGTTWERQLEARHALYQAREVARAGGDLSGLTPLPEDAAQGPRAYRLGKTLVPLPDAEPELDTRPALEILHFVHASTVRPPHSHSTDANTTWARHTTCFRTPARHAHKSPSRASCRPRPCGACTHSHATWRAHTASPSCASWPPSWSTSMMDSTWCACPSATTCTAGPFRRSIAW